MIKLLELIIFFLFVVENIYTNEISVSVENGKINGKIESIDGKEVNVFLGIPYAEPPVGELRFRRPLHKNGWSEPIDATKWPNPCYQKTLFDLSNFQNKNFSEDCLYLNIWSPKLGSSDELKPVIFYIHGGGLLMGSSVERYISGEVLSTRGDVVVVTINYRLNIFGFLYTGTDDAPGNVGLWDQSLALEWVNDNIQYFGGDPKRITISGESAGSWSTSLHILSPISRNLFSNAILMSGASINNQAGDEPKNILKTWIKGAKLIGCANDENEYRFSAEIINCLKNSDPEKLASIINNLNEGIVGVLSVVVVNGKFLPEKPIQMLRNGNFKRNLNLLHSIVEDEGSVMLKFFVDFIKYGFENPQNLTYSEAYNELKTISERLASKHAINGEDVSKVYFTGLSDNNGFDLLRRTIGIAVGDYLLSCPTIQFAKELYKSDNNANVYQWYYTSKIGKEKLLCSKWMGTCHCDDLWPVFGSPFKEFDDHLDREREISAQVIDIYSSFANTGHPSKQNGVDWPKFYTINDNIIAPYLEISAEPKPVTNFGNNLKTVECDYLWKKYIDKN